MTTSIGAPIPRVDGYAKVTGAAKYTADIDIPHLTYGYVVSSTITKGKISHIDSRAALALPGVLQVFTYQNRPNLPWFDAKFKDQTAPPGSPFRALFDITILYNGQPVALVVAETFELARYAASLVEVTYEPEPHQTDLAEVYEEAKTPKKKRMQVPPPAKPRGDAEAAFEDAPVKHEADYLHHFEHHNPMEMHASIVIWEEDGTLTIYDKTQGVQNSQKYVANVFGFDKKAVRVLSPYVGGAFGSGLRPQYQLALAVMAACELKRAVKVVLTRQQMFTFGYRPDTTQHLALGATEDGTLTSIQHHAIANTSRFEAYQEDVVNWSGLLYACENSKFSYKLAELDLATPIDMRAPGGATGMFALECAIDELAYKLEMDPLAFRLKNYSERDQNEDKPYSSKALRDCYTQGAARFGWANRPMAARSMREGNEWVGWGMANGVWLAPQAPAGAKALLSIDGSLQVSSATADIGTGTYTIMSQVAAETLGIPLEKVTAKLGDSAMPMSPVEGGSTIAATISAAVQAVCQKVGDQLLKLAQQMDDSPFAHRKREDVLFENGQLVLREDSTVALSILEIMRANDVNFLEAEAKTMPNILKVKQYSFYTHSAVFAEVRVDEQLGKVRVTRMVSAVAAGRILNPQTARSQIMGGVVWGISMALEEDTFMDHRLGRFMNHNLAEYHIPVNADIPEIDVLFVQEPDEHVNPLGVKGVGEIGIIGTPAAIVNAIFHATGKRMRELPVTLDKLL